MTPVLVALGSNVGDSLANLRQAVTIFREEFGPVQVSHIYKTQPMYVEDQPQFLNAAVGFSVDCGPRTLLAFLKRAENKIGRLDGERYGPREVDLDLIAFGALSYRYESDNKNLEIPHPKISERRFVLQPLADIAPDLHIIGLGRVADLLARTNSDADAVVRLDDAEL